MVEVGDLWIKRDESDLIVFIVDIEKDYLVKYQVVGVEDPNTLRMYKDSFKELFKKVK